jgi:hypothetical protein
LAGPYSLDAVSGLSTVNSFLSFSKVRLSTWQGRNQRGCRYFTRLTNGDPSSVHRKVQAHLVIPLLRASAASKVLDLDPFVNEIVTRLLLQF